LVYEALRAGKLDWKLMTKFLSVLPTSDIDVLMGPTQGEDAAVIRLGDGFLVVHSNPITTGVKYAGYLAVHVAGNDIAVRGVRPRWFLPVVLLPSSYSDEDILDFFSGMSRALNEIGGVVVGGHTEITPGITRPLVTMTAIGYTKTRVILTRDARVGDLVYVVGRVAGEGAGIIAWDFENLLIERGIDRNLINVAKRFVFEVSVIPVALKLKDYVRTMHDVTEGGVLQALREIAIASNTAIVVDREKIQLEEAVKALTRGLGIDPLKVISSGCIIAIVPSSMRRDFENAAESLGKTFSLIGHVEGGKGEVYVRNGGNVEVINEDIVDEIYKLWY